MKQKVIVLISTALLFSCSYTERDKELEVETDYNIETLIICFELADKGFWNVPFSDYQPLKYKARSTFEQYRDHRAIHLIDSLIGKGFWLDESYFESVNNEVRENLPDKHLIAYMEDYYGRQNESYSLIPSPTLWRIAALGIRIKGISGFKVYKIFGPLIMTKDSIEFGYGYHNGGQLYELSVHEFGHSFINPLTELPDNKAIIDRYEYLYYPIEENMRIQGYNDWWSCLTEHIIRLGEIRISCAAGDSLSAERIRNDYINNRHFIYLPILEENIQDYENNRNKYPSIEEYIPILLESLNEIDTADYDYK